MIMPSVSVILVAVAVLAILLVLNWFIGGVAYNRRFTHQAHDLSKDAEAALTKKAAAKAQRQGRPFLSSQLDDLASVGSARLVKFESPIREHNKLLTMAGYLTLNAW